MFVSNVKFEVLVDEYESRISNSSPLRRVSRVGRNVEDQSNSLNLDLMLRIQFQHLALPRCFSFWFSTPSLLISHYKASKEKLVLLIKRISCNAQLRINEE